MAGRDRSQLLTGVFLAVIGSMLMLSTFGIIQGFNWRLLFRLWPLLLIFIGLNLLFKSTRLWWIVPLLLVVVIVSLFVFDQPFPGRFYFPVRIGRDFRFSPIVVGNSSTYRSSAELTEEIKSLQLELSFEAGKLDIQPLREQDLLYKADFRYQEIKPQVEYLRGGNSGAARLLIDSERTGRMVNPGGNEDDWQLYLTREIPLEINVNAGAGKFDLDLEGLQAGELTVNVGAGDLNLNLGMESRRLTLNSGAANVELNLPRELGVEIRTTGVISTNNFTEVGLIREGSTTYRSGNFQETTDRLEIFISAAASRIELDFN